MGMPVLGSDHFPELRPYNLGLDASTPLWYYTLAEADVMGEEIAALANRADDIHSLQAGTAADHRHNVMVRVVE